MCNPEHEPIRYQFLLKHFPSRGIPLDRVKWVRGPWGSELTSQQFFEHYDPFDKHLGISHALSFKSAALLRAEVSLILTFREAVRQALEDGHPHVIIFESDVLLRDDFLERLAVVLADAKNRQWDYISLSEGVGTRPNGHNPSYFGPTKLYDPPWQWVFRCGDSNLLCRSFLMKLSQGLEHVRECLDWELNAQIIAFGGKALWVDPPLVEPGSGRWRFISQLPG